jgi:hypothetical protein
MITEALRQILDPRLVIALPAGSAPGEVLPTAARHIRRLLGVIGKGNRASGCASRKDLGG